MNSLLKSQHGLPYVIPRLSILAIRLAPVPEEFAPQADHLIRAHGFRAILPS